MDQFDTPQADIEEPLAEATDTVDGDVTADEEIDDVLVEEISIDGMCGVY